MISEKEKDAIDQRIAIKIMGWAILANIPGMIEKGWDGWQPTRNIEQAWQVLEKLGFYFKLSKIYGGTYECILYTDELDEYDAGEIFEVSETAPLAISLAALKTLDEVKRNT